MTLWLSLLQLFPQFGNDIAFHIYQFARSRYKCEYDYTIHPWYNYCLYQEYAFVNVMEHKRCISIYYNLDRSNILS